MPHWTLDDIPWDKIDHSKVDPKLLAIIKAAALVEFNAQEYVGYLHAVFPGDDAFKAHATEWGIEETQHGNALRRWAELADPTFNFDQSFKRFTEGYQQVPKDAAASVRGSRAGELIARCIVEMGTSHYYTVIKESCDEPVLKILAAHIAADEMRHYKLFYSTLKKYREQEGLNLWGRIKVALGRVAESNDDELAYAYFAANTAPDAVYNRATYQRLYAAGAYPLYRRHHVESMAAMLLKAVGLAPRGWLSHILSTLAWNAVRWQTSRLAAA